MAEERIVTTSRPATVVTPVVLVEGKQIDRTIGVDSITIRKEVNRIPWAKIVIVDGDASAQNFKLSSSNLFLPGSELEIQSGYQNDTKSLFKGIIVRHSIKMRSGGESILVLECKDKSVGMTSVRDRKSTRLNSSHVRI